MNSSLYQEGLEEKVERLEKENEYLKSLLEKYQIEFDPLPFIHDEKITEVHVRFFYSMFRGRSDVYAKRSGKPNSKTGKAGYYPQCANFWKDGYCPRKQGMSISCQKCDNRQYLSMTGPVLMAHLKGEKEDGSDVIGIYPLLPDGRCNFLVFDFDDHEMLGNQWMVEVDGLRKMCQELHVPCLVERSRSGNGAHVWLFFKHPIQAVKARKFGTLLLTKGLESIELKSFASYDRMIPAQDWLEKGKIGNLVALPLQGGALKNGNSAFVDEQWNPYPNQWRVLKHTQKISEEFIDDCIKEWDYDNPLGPLFDDSICALEEEKPWNTSSLIFAQEDVSGAVKLVRADQLYVEATNLKPRFLNQIRRLASFSNSEFYKTQRMGYSTRGLSRIIACYDNFERYIAIPRGLEENLIEKLNQASIEYEIEDQTVIGYPLRVQWKGNLYPRQQQAVDSLRKHNDGILSASTAFGKTVVGASLIAQIKKSTLILVHTTEILNGWVEELERFLSWDEPLPEYKTPTGRKKIRKSHIGVLYAGKDTCAGKIDVALISSVSKKENEHPFLSQYGMVIMDECHHIPSKTYEQVIQKVPARYRYGFSATPKREDGQEPKIFMYFGPIRYRFSARDRAMQQGIQHLVVPRFTSLRLVNEKEVKIQEAYQMAIENVRRNDLIVKDIQEAVKKGRTPLVLSRSRRHAQYLYRRLEGVSDQMFLLQGGKTPRERSEIRRKMKEVREKESLILIAIDKYIGEGFNYPRLDTLFLTTPFKNDVNVEQYVGRLNRDYAGKENVIVYDYVDSHVRFFQKMYQERLRTYKKIGYVLTSGVDCLTHATQCIYDEKNYKEVFQKDLHQARREVVVCCSNISWKTFKEYKLLFEEMENHGSRIYIFTNESNDSSNLEWEKGKLIFRKNLYEQFAVIDRKIVWYGNINLIGEDTEEGRVMRIVDSRIADELVSGMVEEETLQMKLF